MFELLRPMKLLTLSVLIIGWLAMGSGIFADQLDSSIINTVTAGIFADDSDDSPDETKTSSRYGTTTAFCSGTGAAKVIVFTLFKELLNTPSTPRYKMHCVYRL